MRRIRDMQRKIGQLQQEVELQNGMKDKLKKLNKIDNGDKKYEMYLYRRIINI